jgi:rod shape-determining protein MreC
VAVYRRSSRTRNVLAVLVLAALTVLTIDARSHGTGVVSDLRAKVSDAFSPLQRATHDALRPVGNFLYGAVHYGSLQAENQRLRQQLASASTEEAAAAAERQQAEQVLAEQGLPFVGAIPTVSAQIIDVGSSNFDNTITIDRGTANGVAAGQPAVAAGGLVGTVRSAASHTATIELLTDPAFDVGVSLQGGNIGSAEGQGGAAPMRVTVDTTPLAPPVQKVGDVLVTSGLEVEKFPRGIPVGRVSRVVKVPNAIEPDIEITPLVDPLQIGYVSILLWAPQ